MNSEPSKILFGAFFFGLFFLGSSSFGVPLCLVFLLLTFFFGGVPFSWSVLVSISMTSFRTKLFMNFCGSLGFGVIYTLLFLHLHFLSLKVFSYIHFGIKYLLPERGAPDQVPS